MKYFWVVTYESQSCVNSSDGEQCCYHCQGEEVSCCCCCCWESAVVVHDYKNIDDVGCNGTSHGLMSQPPSTCDQAHLDKDIGNLVFVHQQHYGEHQLKLDTAIWDCSLDKTRCTHQHSWVVTERLKYFSITDWPLNLWSHLMARFLVITKIFIFFNFQDLPVLVKFNDNSHYRNILIDSAKIAHILILRWQKYLNKKCIVVEQNIVLSSCEPRLVRLWHMIKMTTLSSLL